MGSWGHGPSGLPPRKLHRRVSAQYVEVVEPNSHVFFAAVFWGFVKATGIGWVPFLDGSGHVVCIVTTQGTLSRLVVGWLLPLNKNGGNPGFQKATDCRSFSPILRHSPNSFPITNLEHQFTMIVLHSFLEKPQEKKTVCFTWFGGWLHIATVIGLAKNHCVYLVMVELSPLEIISGIGIVHPWSLTRNLKHNPWKRKFLLETIIFRFHVKLWGCSQ